MKRTKRTGWLVLVVSISLGWMPQRSHAAEAPKILSLNTQPKATTRPALGTRLLPSIDERTPGDAAPVYLTAALLSVYDMDPFKEATADDAKAFGLAPEEGRDWVSIFLEAPLEKLKPAPKGPATAPSPRHTVEEFLSSRQNAIQYLQIAGRRETCKWDTPVRDLGAMTLLPHLSQLRSAAHAVTIKARRQLAMGDVNGAILTLQSNFALVRALDQQAVLIQTLVAASIGAESLNVLREAIGQPNCPNLYWALTNLPRPMLDLRASMETERLTIVGTLPELLKARKGEFTEQDWTSLMRRFASLLPMLGKSTPSFANTLGQIAAGAMIYADARRWFLARGMTAEQIDEIPKPVLMGRFLIQSYDEFNDEILKWSGLPAWQALPGARRAEEAFRKEQLRGGVSNPVLAIIPAVYRATFSVHRLDRDIAALQTVEAVRAFAADHSGALPKTLEEIVETPTPIDPMTGKHFAYQVDGRTITLESHTPDESPRDALILKVTISKD